MGVDEAYLAWDLGCRSGLTDVLVADLGELGFEAFEEVPEGLRAFIPESQATDLVRSAFTKLAGRLDVEVSGPTRIEAANWNLAWESTITPVYVGPFVIHPPWHDAPGGSIAICVEPKMSFGTGHHESTRLILSILTELVHPGDRVLDAGTGTGILAIASAFLEARHTVAFDTDPWSIQNARENVAANALLERIDLFEGDLDAVPDGRFDVILANINRNVLLDLLASFAARMVPGGRLALAGILVSDREEMNAALGRAGFRPLFERIEGDWITIASERK